MALTLSISVPLVVSVTRIPESRVPPNRAIADEASARRRKVDFLAAEFGEFGNDLAEAFIEMGGSRVSRQCLHISHLRLHP
ncbi:MAG: hypothetical protein U0X93_12625 [Anaerolineales bacterium]